MKNRILKRMAEENKENIKKQCDKAYEELNTFSGKIFELNYLKLGQALEEIGLSNKAIGTAIYNLQKEISEVSNQIKEIKQKYEIE